ncbi:PQQ-binding-like beta-propeller repeat protein [Frankia sp. AgB1.9]|uniref:outer membrane protein assembly factor BamB family protein n=1 Tax=unclassified Frankia TaxID=2632575 RepID=UPI00193137C3|nr:MULTISPECIES: PQQ-binding-like beta-propeller repeat protein [unclassified Frankia]MBL7547553.1 PQQ-binding-like beta-propeller repeat protein [Frankia sp. AgB1.9]
MVQLAAVGAGVAVVATHDRGPETVRQAWSNDLVALGKPVAARGSVLVFSSTDEKVVDRIAALDPATGRARWTAPASISRIEGDLGRFTPLVVDDGATVVWLAPGGADDTVSVVAADAATGEQRWSYGEDLSVAAAPRVCGNGSAICLVAAADNDAGPPSKVVLDARSGRVRVEEPLGIGDDTREVGVDLILSGDDETLAAVADGGNLLWQEPATNVFGATADGVLFIGMDSVRRGDVYVGSPLNGLLADTLSPVAETDLNALVGISATTGERLWTRPGATLGCPRIAFDPTHPVRCVFRGTVTAGLNAAFANFGVTLEGFDLETGRTTWSWDAGDSWVFTNAAGAGPAARGQGGDFVLRVSDTRYVLRVRGETTVLDLERGPVSAKTPATGWCTSWSQRWSGVEWPYACDTAGRDAVPSAPVEFGGVRVGDDYVWLDRNGRPRGGPVTG